MKHFYSKQNSIQHVYSKGSQTKLAGCQDKSQYIPYVFPLSMTAREESALGFIWRCNSIMEYFGSVGSNAFRVLCSAGLLCPGLKAAQTPGARAHSRWHSLGSDSPYSNLPWGSCCCFLACLALLGRFQSWPAMNTDWPGTACNCTLHWVLK